MAPLQEGLAKTHFILDAVYELQQPVSAVSTWEFLGCAIALLGSIASASGEMLKSFPFTLTMVFALCRSKEAALGGSRHKLQNPQFLTGVFIFCSTFGPCSIVGIIFASQGSPVQNWGRNSPLLSAFPSVWFVANGGNIHFWHGRRAWEVDSCLSAGRTLSCIQRKTRVISVTSCQSVSPALPPWSSRVWGAR